ncbi:MAG: hypothetical protein WC022_02255 [Parcubacteria group bacterium]
MKKIYVAHASNYSDFKETLYSPLKTLKDFEFIFPYEKEGEMESTKGIIKDCDLFIGDVSFQKLGTGIEIGWADSFDVPILLVYKKGSSLSRSLNIVTDNFLEYDSVEDNLVDIASAINKII